MTRGADLVLCLSVRGSVCLIRGLLLSGCGLLVGWQRLGFFSPRIAIVKVLSRCLSEKFSISCGFFTQPGMYDFFPFWSSALYARAFALQEQLSTMSGTVVTTNQAKARIPIRYISTKSDQSTSPSSTTEASTSLERTKEKTPPRRALRKEMFP